MQGLDRAALPLESLNHPSWDPICFASNEAFVYLLPGLVRLVFAHAEAYLPQFLFQLGQPERLDIFLPPQAQVLIQVLDYLVEHEANALDRSMSTDDLFRVREQLVECAAQG